ncbi:hypothetical protein JL193_05375 [Polaribacter batillariae]|uniref:Cysteine-rich CPCC domain-containing protein n=1 Tax=Polaribacter batillariae TaxID=2808900 RepID=A0ABX7T0T9_9FLAO|nr:CPCC family cysteine-rich protein [Polaribacter batillariae]QTD38698.1 hypothetical protein JL193_05375 [Polaribacter batillariae]
MKKELKNRAKTSHELKILQNYEDRKNLFESYLKQYEELSFICASCGYPTINKPASYEVCSICEWEDNGYNDNQLFRFNHATHEPLTLFEYRINIGEQILSEPKTFFDAKNIILSIKEYENKFDIILEKYYSKKTTKKDKSICEQNFQNLKKELFDNLKIRLK